jgi:hypothetical protein
MKARERLLIVAIAFVCASGGFLIGRISADNGDRSKEAHHLPTEEIFHISLSEDSKPEEGLYLISFRSTARHMQYFVTYYGFTLGENAEGFEGSSLSSPHGSFSGFDLLPHATVELQARLLPKEGYLEEQFGMESRIYPSPNDTVYLRGFARVSELEKGTCREIEFIFPVKDTPLKEFLDEKSLRELKSEHTKPFDYSKLPPITE